MNISLNNYIPPFIIAFIWGLSPVLLKYLIKHNNIPTYIIILIQSIVYFTASVIYIILYESNNVFVDSYNYKQYIPLIAFISLLSVYIANVLYVNALRDGMKVNIISIIISLYPIITFIFGFLLLNETLTLKSLLGFCFILLGVIFIFI